MPKSVQSNHDVMYGIARQIQAYLVDSFNEVRNITGNDFSGRPKLERFDELVSKLQLSDDERLWYLTNVIDGLIRNDQFDNIVTLVERYNYPLEDVKDRLRVSLIKTGIYRATARALKNACNVLGININEFASDIEQAMVSTIENGTIKLALEVKDELGYTDEQFSNLIKRIIEHGDMPNIIKQIDRIPETIITHLEHPYYLASYRLEMRLPMIDINDAANYDRYFEIKKLNDQERLNQFLAKASRANLTGQEPQESVRLVESISSKMMKQSVNPHRLKAQLTAENVGRTDDRDLWQIDDIYAHSLGDFFGESKRTSVKDAVERIARQGKPIRILDQGAGQGIVLKELKEQLADDGFQVETTAIEIDDEGAQARTQLLQWNGIDRVINKPAEVVVPDQYYDLIMDNYAAVSYTEQWLRKDLILKNCYSLRPGGLMLVAVDLSNYHDEPTKRDVAEKYPHVILETFSPTGQRSHAGSEGFRVEAQNIERTLEKRGFKAKFYFVKARGENYHIRLIIQRVR